MVRMRYAAYYMYVVLQLAVACKAPERAGALQATGKRIGITLQQRKEFVFNAGAIVFSNRFAAARANKISQVNDSTFAVTILPENTPVNPSPWYAFSVRSRQPRKLYMQLLYGRIKHRYNPKISRDGITWTDPVPVQLNKDSTQASFTLWAGNDSIIVAGQEMMNATASYRWMDSLAILPFVQQQVIGHSLMGKPLVALHTTGSGGKKIVVVLSRQHPPEVTGYMAMQSFVREVLSETPLAQRFREQYELVMIPMLNPDGVDEGNWRHSAAGVDLNRDWEQFKQPETSAVKDFLLATLQRQEAKVYFGIDFHSTYKDVFYTNSDTLTHLPGFTKRWLRAFEKAFPGFRANVKPSGNGGNVSKSWMMRALGCDALTYEVGDDTPRELLKQKGRVAAVQMMELLLKEHK